MNEANWLENEETGIRHPIFKEHVVSISAVHFYPKPTTTRIAKATLQKKRHFNNERYISIHTYSLLKTASNHSHKQTSKHEQRRVLKTTLLANTPEAIICNNFHFWCVRPDSIECHTMSSTRSIAITMHLSNKITHIHQSTHLKLICASLGCIRWMKIETPHLWPPTHVGYLHHCCH